MPHLPITGFVCLSIDELNGNNQYIENVVVNDTLAVVSKTKRKKGSVKRPKLVCIKSKFILKLTPPSLFCQYKIS